MRKILLGLCACTCLLHADLVTETDIVSLEESFVHPSKEGFSEMEQKLCSAIEAFQRLDEMESFEDFCRAARLLHDDFQAIVSQEPEGTRLHSAAVLRRDLLSAVAGLEDASAETFLLAMQAISEGFLRPFATAKNEEGLQLREDIYNNILSNPKAFDEFKTYVLLMEDDPLVVLGKTAVEDFQVLGVESTDESGSFILVRYKYTRDLAVYECECGF